MRGLVPRIHVFVWCQDVDGRVKPGHDVQMLYRYGRGARRARTMKLVAHAPENTFRR
jgi:hypothetical protein